MVDVAIKAWIVLRVGDNERLAALQRRTCDSAVGRQPQLCHHTRDRGVIVRHVGKIEFVAVAIEQQYRGAFGIERPSAFRYYERKQLHEVGFCREGASELIEQSE